MRAKVPDTSRRLRFRLRLSVKMSRSLLPARSGPQGLELDTRLLVDLGQQVPVTAVGERDARVPGSSGDLGRVHPGSGQDGHTGVLEIVRPQRRQPGCLDGGMPESRPPVRRVERSAVTAREDVGCASESFEVARELGCHR